MSEPESLVTDVAIVGGGPVGLMLALFLDRHGVRSAVFNSAETTLWHPKGSTHNARTMEHYRRVGLAAVVRQLGLPADHPTDVAYFTQYNGWELARLPMPSEQEKAEAVRRAARIDQTPEPIHRANQMYVERALLDKCRRTPRITLRFGCHVESFTPSDERVVLRAERRSSKSAIVCESAYLVGCDGGRSSIRRALGIHYQGHRSLKQAFLEGDMVSAHLRIPALYRDLLGGRRAWQYVVINPKFRMLLVALDGRDEFLMMSKPEHAGSPSTSELVRSAQRGIGKDVPVDVLGHFLWTSGQALCVERFQSGRVFLAGDSAHLFTPTGGFGMNTGIDDAANLAWKLAARVQGWGGRHLLASYDVERKPIAHRNTGAARALAKNIGGMATPEALDHDSPEGVQARDVTAAQLSTFGEQFASLGVQLGARYDSSPIIAAEADAPTDSFVTYRPTSLPGGRTPHVWLGETRTLGSSLYDRLGRGFTLLRLGPNAPCTRPFECVARSKGIPLETLCVPNSTARDLYERDLVLVRPDQHVSWRGNRIPERPESVLERSVGDLS